MLAATFASDILRAALDAVVQAGALAATALVVAAAAAVFPLLLFTGGRRRSVPMPVDTETEGGAEPGSDLARRTPVDA